MRKYIIFFCNETFTMKNNFENIAYEKITVHVKTLVTGAGTEIVGNFLFRFMTEPVLLNIIN